MAAQRWVAVVAAGLVFLAGCGSSDSGETEFVLNPGALTLARLTTNTADDTSPVWNPAGNRLAFVSARTGHPEVWVLEPASLTLDRITTTEAEMVSRPSWAPDGESLVVAIGDSKRGQAADGEANLWLISYLFTLPRLEALTQGPERDDWPAWSPDGTSILFSRDDSLRTVPATGGNIEPFDAGGLTGAVIEPAWSPDGQNVAYTVFDGEDYDIYVQRVDGGSPVPLACSEANERSPTWSSGGGHIAYQSDASGSWDIWLVSAGGENPQNLTPGSLARDVQPSWSPESSRIAFCSDRSGNDDIWIMDGIPYLN